MAETVRIKNTGLRGVTVADSKISFIDPEKGVLIYRGYRIEELADKSNFMETAYLLINGRLPDAEEAARFTADITQSRRVPPFIFDAMKKWPKDAKPMDVLQAAVPLLAMIDEHPSDKRDEMVACAIGLIARLPVLTAGWHRIRQGLDPLSPNEDMDHAQNFLYLLAGRKPDPEIARMLDVCLILHADHTFNASTFACREVVSTRAHIYAGIAAGVGALSGSLHGGANERVMKMLLDLKNEKDVPGWVKKRLDAGERIMGLGHAVYKTGDPRASTLKEMGERLAERTGQKWVDLTNTIETTALAEFEARGRTGIQPNVDFRSASVYFMMGIPMDLMTPIFAISRVAGWCAHIIEEVFAEAQGKPALYRPKAHYVGEYCGLMGCEYEAMEKRER